MKKELLGWLEDNVRVIRHWFTAEPTNLLLAAEAAGLGRDETGDDDVVAAVALKILVVFVDGLAWEVFSALKKVIFCCESYLRKAGSFLLSSQKNKVSHGEIIIP